MEISDLEHDRKVKFTRHTHFTQINTIFEYCHVRAISEIQVTFFLFMFRRDSISQTWNLFSS